MDTKSRRSFMSQFAKARRAVAKLRKQYPECFDAQGRAIVAAASFPRIEHSTRKEGQQ